MSVLTVVAKIDVKNGGREIRLNINSSKSNFFFDTWIDRRNNEGDVQFV